MAKNTVDNTSINDTEVEDETMTGPQKVVAVIAAIWTFVIVAVNIAMMLEWTGTFWEWWYDKFERYQVWLIVILGLLTVAVWAAGKFHRSDVREDRRRELEARREATHRRSGRNKTKPVRKDVAAVRASSNGHKPLPQGS